MEPTQQNGLTAYRNETTLAKLRTGSESNFRPTLNNHAASASPIVGPSGYGNVKKKGADRRMTWMFKFFEEKLEPIKNTTFLGSHRPPEEIEEEFVKSRKLGIAWNYRTSTSQKQSTAYVNRTWKVPKTPHVVTNTDLEILHSARNNSNSNNKNDAINEESDISLSLSESTTPNRRPQLSFGADVGALSDSSAYTTFSQMQANNPKITMNVRSRTSSSQLQPHPPTQGNESARSSPQPKKTGYVSVSQNNALASSSEDFSSKSFLETMTQMDALSEDTNFSEPLKGQRLTKYGIPVFDPHARTTSHSPLPNQNGYRQWNSEFQKTLKEVNEAAFGIPEKNFELASIAKQFVDTATTYGKIIISELSVKNPEFKSLKPHPSLGGVAGGTKYVHGNILFKLGQDILLEENPDFWMYGGTAGPNDEAAMKSLTNEIMGLSAHMTTFVPGLRYPLMAAVDFKGFRLLALSIIPITPDTLIYGSNDGGVTCHNSDLDVADKMRQVADKINIKTHLTGFTTPRMISGPGDIEVHRGLDNELYVLDFGRLLPPEDPSFARDHDPRAPFFKLLRTEFVKSLSFQLNPDALSDFHVGDRSAVEGDRLDLAAATKILFTQIIPAFAKNLEKVEALHRIAENTCTSVSDLTHSLASLTPGAVHRGALNYRHLGAVRAASQSAVVRQAVLLVCLARTLKTLFKDVQRKTMHQVSVPSDEPFARALVAFVAEYRAPASTSEAKWNALIRATHHKFPACFSSIELKKGATLRAQINEKYLLFLFFKVSLIKLRKRAVASMWSTFSSFVLTLDDIKALEAKVKHAPVIPFATAMLTLTKADQKKEEPAEYLRLLKVAESKFEDAHSVATVCPFSFFHWGNTATLIAEGASDPTEKASKFDQAHQRFELALKYSPGFDLLLQGYSHSLNSHADFDPSKASELKSKLGQVTSFSESKAQKQAQTLDYEGIKDE